ncbi:MAG: DUF2723 domain-containing protein, partial [Victivallales bacterium]|nr:DUF2723 domain-containing protein [Victivallales bacterium]
MESTEKQTITNLALGPATAIVFLATVALYLGTALPGIGWGDGVDFVLCAHYLGVPHPTGYPLIALLGKLASFIPVGTLAFRVGLLSSIAGAAAAAVFFRLAVRLGRSLMVGQYATGILVFSTFLWQQAISIEVYSLNLFFCLCMIALSEPIRGKSGARMFLVLIFVACVGLGNHGTLILPALLLGVMGLFYQRRMAVQVITVGAFLVLIGFTLYLCLPLFSARSDIFDWNSPSNPANFPALLSGFDFWVAGEYKTAITWRNSKLLLGSIARQAWPPLIICFVFFLALKIRRRGAKSTLLAVFALSAIFPVLYPTHEKEAFFLIAWTVFLLLTVMGFAATFARNPSSRTAKFAALILIPLAAFHFYFLSTGNYSTTDISH